MILTLTLNPAVDKSTSVGQVITEKKLRCGALTAEAGGGGINVSKAIQELGGQSLALFPAGGHNGKRLLGLLKEKSISFQAIPVEAETRENFTVTETSTGSQYRFVLPGGRLSEGEIHTLLSAVPAVNPTPGFVVISGSLPPGAPDDLYGKIAAACKAKEVKCIADTSGMPLQKVAAEGVFLLKPNLSELCSLAGVDRLESYEVDEAAREIIYKGYCQVAVISMGTAGALLVTKDQVVRVAAPVVKKLSTVGAGDSMVGGMTWMLEQGKSLKEVVQFGVACGTAATMNPGTALFKKQDVLRLYEWLRLQDP